VLAGARLQRVRAATAPAPTASSASPRTLRNPELSALSGVTQSAQLDAAAKSFLADGVTIPAGTTHLWEYPGNFSLALTGTAGVRITFMDRAGNVLRDTEIAVSRQASLESVTNCELVAITCLGSLPAGKVAIAGGFGAVSSATAAAGSIAVVGWQSGNLLPQVGAASLLARGATLRLRQAHIGSLSGQKLTQAMTRVSSAIAGQAGAETWLPKSIGVVMVILDQRDATAAENGDLAIACEGATLAVPPVAGAGGKRRALLYDVSSRDEKAEHITISVASKAGWVLAGIVGLPGHAVEWAARLHGQVPPHLVPDGPLTTDGQVRVRLTPSTGGNS
jgi:hypothetical protein